MREQLARTQARTHEHRVEECQHDLGLRTQDTVSPQTHYNYVMGVIIAYVLRSSGLHTRSLSAIATCLTLRRRIKSHLLFAGIIRSSPFSPR